MRVEPITLAVKLASIVVHADEVTSPGGHPFDSAAIRSLLADPEVTAFLGSLDPALLPVKRPPAPTPDDGTTP